MSKHDIPTYYGAELSWVIYALNQIIRIAEKLFLVCERYQNEHYVYTDHFGTFIFYGFIQKVCNC